MTGNLLQHYVIANDISLQRVCVCVSITDNVCPSLACCSAQPADKKLCEQEHPPLLPPWNSTWTSAPGCKDEPMAKEIIWSVQFLMRKREKTWNMSLSRRDEQIPCLSQSWGATCFLQLTSSELRHCYSSDTPGNTHTHVWANKHMSINMEQKIPFGY